MTARADSSELDELWDAMQRGTADEAAVEFCTRHPCARTPFSADWKFFFAFPADAHIVELGSGFGDDLVELAGQAARVTSIVPNAANARIVERHLQDRKIANATVHVAERIESLPLEDGTASAIAMEDAAAPGFGIDGASLARVAAEWRRVLAPGGTVFLGLDNRYARAVGLRLAQRVMRSGVDSESLNRYVKLLAPRTSRGMPGLGAVVRALERQGLASTGVHAPLPDEKKTQAVVPVDDRPVLRYFVRNLVRQNSLVARAAVAAADLSVRLGLFRYLVPYYFATFELR